MNKKTVAHQRRDLYLSHSRRPHEYSRMLSRRKQLLFAALPAFVLLLLLFAGEVTLRLFDPSLASPLLREVTADGTLWYEVNRGYLQRYFPLNVPVVPELKPERFRAEKSKGVFRVFCLGESTMFGTPYVMNATVPAILRKQLRALYPGREIEVVNFGAAAVNSNVILDLTRQLVDYEPDVILLYAGHNEFYGPDGVGAPWIERWLPFLIPLKYEAYDIRLLALARSFLQKSPETGPGGERNLMRQVSDNTLVRPGSGAAERIFSRFAANLSAIAAVCRSRGIPLVVSDVTSNILVPPFAFDTLTAGAGGQSVFTTAPALFAAGKYTALAGALEPLLRSDSANAFIEYWLGRVRLATGETRGGKALLERAKDDDLLKFRAPARINAIIRSECTADHVPFVSSDSLFASSSPGGIPGDELFWEHLHPTVRGYYDIACLYLTEIINLGLLRESTPPEGPRAFLPFSMDSLSIPWLELAHADLAVAFMTSRWPFRGFTTVPRVLGGADSTLRSIATQVYHNTLDWNLGCYRTAEVFEHKGMFREAETTYESLLENSPRNSLALYLLGNLFRDQGRYAGAALWYRKSIAANNTYEYPRIDLALIEINGGNLDDALRQLNAADSLSRGKDEPLVRATIYYGLAAVYANRGEFPRARRMAEESLRLFPAYTAALSLKRALDARR